MTAKDLRNALLQEAVQGKLVPQIASEGNARDLLEEIRKARGESLPLATARKRSSATPSAGTPRNAPMEITEDEIPFDIPESWCWCRLGDIANISTGMTPLKSESRFYENGNIPWITSSLTNNEYIENAEYFITEYAVENTSLTLYPKNTLILAMYGQGKTRGQISELLIPATINQACAAIELFLDDDYFRKYIKLFHNWNYNNVRKEASGSAQPNLNLGKVQSTLIPLPPLAEQKRIVAAIEKFMPFVEEYGKKETVLNQLNAQIGTLTKKAILQEAVQGKLVPQIPAEGNAKDLLEQIKAQKTALIKEGKIKKEKPLPEITEDEIPFDIPENWCWCRLGECINEGHQGINTAGDHVQFVTENGVPIIQTGDITQGFINIENTKLMSFVDYDFYKEKYQPQYNDIFFCNIGTLGKPVIYRENFTMLFHWNLFIVKYNSEKILPEYLQMYFENCVYDLEKKLSGTALKFISKKVFLEMLVPLPPLSEQKRIVEAIEKLLPLCEKLGR